MRPGNIKFIWTSFGLALATILFTTSLVFAQTSVFTYQGRLTDSGAPANGNYDLQFALFDNTSGGAQIGATQTVSTASVSGGIFTVKLDFGVSAFPGADRFLEISVRPSGGSGFTTLTPRQQISSTPYAIRTLSAGTADTATNATQLGGVAASQYVKTTDARLSDARSPTAGNSNYVQNTTTKQAGVNFNIDGNGTIGGTLSANNVGIGTTNPQAKLHVANGDALMTTAIGNAIQFGTPNAETGMSIRYPTIGRADLRFDGQTLKLLAGADSGPPASTNGISISTAGNVGIGITQSFSTKLTVVADNTSAVEAISAVGFIGIETSTNSPNGIALISGGHLQLDKLGSGGDTPLCWRSTNPDPNLIATCGSSLRYKTDLQPFGGGLNIINRLHPITFKWKSGKRLDVGFSAEDVAEVEPLFITHNDKGEVEGVKYDRLSAVFVNAFKEQQQQIERQEAEAKQQEEQIEALHTANAALNARLRSVERIVRKRVGWSRRRR